LLRALLAERAAYEVVSFERDLPAPEAFLPPAFA
jgi:hypothetical protein